MTSLTSLRADPHFFKLWSGQTISAFGSIISGVAFQSLAIMRLLFSPIRQLRRTTGEKSL